MTNVLPQAAQKNLWREYRARLIILFSALLILGSVLGGVVLIPSFLAIRDLSEGMQASRQTAAEESEVTELVETQALLVQLMPTLAATSSVTSAIRAALILKPAGVSVDRISYAAGTPGQITLSGAAGRQAVTDYRSRLSNDPHFTSVVVPVGTLVGADIGRFTLTLSGSF